MIKHNGKSKYLYPKYDEALKDANFVKGVSNIHVCKNSFGINSNYLSL